MLQFQFDQFILGHMTRLNNISKPKPQQNLKATLTVVGFDMIMTLHHHPPHPTRAAPTDFGGDPRGGGLARDSRQIH